jgi:hypothetical protein
MRGYPETLPMFLGDVKARHDKMAEKRLKLHQQGVGRRRHRPGTA